MINKIFALPVVEQLTPVLSRRQNDGADVIDVDHPRVKASVALNGAHRLTVPFTPVSGAWVHVAAVRRNDRLMIFVNGELRGTVNSPMEIPSTIPVTIGASNNVTLPFKGRMDEFRVSRVARYNDNFIPPARPYRLGE